MEDIHMRFNRYIFVSLLPYRWVLFNNPCHNNLVCSVRTPYFCGKSAFIQSCITSQPLLLLEKYFGELWPRSCLFGGIHFQFSIVNFIFHHFCTTFCHLIVILPLIFKGLHIPQVAQYHAPDRQRAAGFQLEGFAWQEAVITGAPPEVFLPVLPSDGWRVLPADLQVYPPIWRAGGRLANTLVCTIVCLPPSWWNHSHHIVAHQENHTGTSDKVGSLSPLISRTLMCHDLWDADHCPCVEREPNWAPQPELDTSGKRVTSISLVAKGRPCRTFGDAQWTGRRRSLPRCTSEAINTNKPSNLYRSQAVMFGLVIQCWWMVWT